jgi:hypothetical protein
MFDGGGKMRHTQFDMSQNILYGNEQLYIPTKVGIFGLKTPKSDPLPAIEAQHTQLKF